MLSSISDSDDYIEQMNSIQDYIQDIIKYYGKEALYMLLIRGKLQHEETNLPYCLPQPGFSSHSLFNNSLVNNYIDIGFHTIDFRDKEKDKSYIEFHSKYYPIELLVTDPFSHKNSIKWNWGGNFWRKSESLKEDELFHIGGNLYFNFGFKEDTSIITFFAYDTFNGNFKLSKGDTISLLFDNGTILDFQSKTKPVSTKFVEEYDRKKHNYIETYYSIPLYWEDMEIFCKYNLKSFRVYFAKEEKMPIDGKFDERRLGEFYEEQLGEYIQDVLHYYVEEYLKAIRRVLPQYVFPTKNIQYAQQEYKFPGCYVYLMRDTTNGYHKIGISNKPEFRERTLQSEKPSIELLASKKYPTRKIAEAIESALHTAYSQQRLRGEWFNLEDADVAAIIETLK